MIQQSASTLPKADSATLSPSSIQELKGCIEAQLPGVALGDTKHPVVLIGDIKGTHRTLTTDDDVRELFAFGSRCVGEETSLGKAIEVRELFPEPGKSVAKHVVRIGAASQPPQVVKPTSPMPPAARKTQQFARRRPQSAGSGRSQAAVARGVSFRACNSGQVGAQARRPASRTEGRPAWRNRLSLAAPVYWHGQERATDPEVPEEVNVPRPPRYDGRPGQRIDRAWAERSHGAVLQKPNLSVRMLEGFGLREEYEQLRLEAAKRAANLKKILAARDRRPGAASFNMYRRQFIDPMSAEDEIGPRRWEAGDFVPISDSHMPELRNAIATFEALAGETDARLRDDATCASWYIVGACAKISEEKHLGDDAVEILPRRVVLESRWTEFTERCNVLFRLFPQGDATATPGFATVFVWLSEAPEDAFTFSILIGDGAVCMAPRLWQTGRLHYRVEVSWGDLEGRLRQMVGGEDCLSITLQVLQWHAPTAQQGGGPSEVLSGPLL